MPAIALTDHGTMFGVIEFYNAARAAGIKPIIGLEAYMAARGMQDRDSKLDKQSTHLLLLAENETGYHNLLTDRQRRPAGRLLLLPAHRPGLPGAKHAEGLIATSGCMAAEIPRAIMAEDLEIVRKKLDWYYDVFGTDNFFLELQQHNIAELPGINKTLLELGERYEATLRRHQRCALHQPGRLPACRISCWPSRPAALLRDPNRMRMSDNSYYLRSPQEMSRIVLPKCPKRITNTLLIAERCNVDLERQGLPPAAVRLCPKAMTAESLPARLCEEGLHRRYGAARQMTRRSASGWNTSWASSTQMGFDTYFLIVWDLCRYAREEGIWYNARGSAAGSIVAYTLDITLVEPIEHGLIFERFLNPGRISMPDIDLDFRDDRRAEIMEYCARKYGDDKVAQIITFGTMGARGALRDVGRVMDIPLSEVDRVAKLIPNIPGKAGQPDGCRSKRSPELQKLL